MLGFAVSTFLRFSRSTQILVVLGHHQELQYMNTVLLRSTMILIITGCGSSSSTSLDIEQELGVEGGTIETSDQSVKLEIPPGAIASNTTIKITHSPTSNMNPDLVVSDTVVELEPHGLNFQKPIVLTILYEESEIASTAEASIAKLMDDGELRLEKIIAQKPGQIQAEILSFSRRMTVACPLGCIRPPAWLQAFANDTERTIELSWDTNTNAATMIIERARLLGPNQPLESDFKHWRTVRTSAGGAIDTTIGPEAAFYIYRARNVGQHFTSAPKTAQRVLILGDVPGRVALVVTPTLGGKIVDSHNVLDCHVAPEIFGTPSSPAKASCQANFLPQKNVQLEAVPYDGWNFVQWEGTCASWGSGPSITGTIAAVAGETIPCTAKFERSGDRKWLTLEIQSTDSSGSLFATYFESAIDQTVRKQCDVGCLLTVADQQSIRLEVKALSNTKLESWTGDCDAPSDQAQLDVAMDQSKVCGVTFTKTGNCIPDCNDRVCGWDGCEGTCGPKCPGDQTCNSSGQCVDQCVPQCTNRQCGPDGCKGLCPTGCNNSACNEDTGQCLVGELRWVAVPAGSFPMGCSDGDDHCANIELPQHQVSVAAFEMTATEVTQEQYESVMGENPSFHQPPKAKTSCPQCPVEWVPRDKAIIFCKTIGGRLPSEAEWEYAARANTNTSYVCGYEYPEFGPEDNNCMDGHAWWHLVAEFKTHPVGTKLANQFGLYDMFGNVAEWVQDPHHGNYHNAPTDGSVWSEVASPGQYTVRGGAYNSHILFLRSSARQNTGATPIAGVFAGIRCAR